MTAQQRKYTTRHERNDNVILLPAARKQIWWDIEDKPKKEEKTMKIYEIDAAIMDCVDAETGEILDLEKLRNLQEERGKKIDNVACWIKNLKAEAEALKKEKTTLEKRQKAAERTIEGLKEYLGFALGGEKFKSSRCQIWYTSSTSVDDSNMNLDELEAFEVETGQTILKPQPAKLDKVFAKQLMEANIEIPSLQLSTKRTVVIK